MKKIILSLSILFSFIPAQALGPVLKAVIISTGATQAGGFHTSTGAVDNMTVSSFTVKGMSNPFITFLNTDNGHMYVGGQPLSGTNVSQASELLTVYGPGGVGGSPNIDFLSFNTGNHGARVGASGGTSGWRRATTYIGANGDNSPDQSVPGIDNDISGYIVFQTSAPAFMKIVNSTTQAQNFYFYNDNSTATWRFENGDGLGNAYSHIQISSTNVIFYPTSNQLVFGQNTSATVTTLNIPNGSAKRTYTLNDVGADASFVMDKASTTFSGANTFNGTSAIRGTQTNDNARSGDYGEFVSTGTTVFSNQSGNGNYDNVVSTTLAPGDYNLSGDCIWSDSGVTVSRHLCAISLFSGNTTTDQVIGYNEVPGSINTGNTSASGATIPLFRVSVNVATTVYLKGRSDYTVGTPTVKGYLVGRRAR